MVRNDKNFKELGLETADYVTAEAVVALLLEHPVLMQRPILVKGDNAVIARPSDKVFELVD
jgi:arsenate reductase